MPLYNLLPDLITFMGGSSIEDYVRKPEQFEAVDNVTDNTINHLMQDFNKTDIVSESVDYFLFLSTIKELMSYL